MLPDGKYEYSKENDPTHPISHDHRPYIPKPITALPTNNIRQERFSWFRTSDSLKWMLCFTWLYWHWTICVWQAGATGAPGVDRTGQKQDFLNVFDATCCCCRLQICLLSTTVSKTVGICSFLLVTGSELFSLAAWWQIEKKNTILSG